MHWRRIRSDIRGAGGDPSSSGVNTSERGASVRRSSTLRIGRHRRRATAARYASTEYAPSGSECSSKECAPRARRGLAAERGRRETLGALALQVEERQRHDGRVDPAAPALDRPLDLEPRAERLVRGATEARPIACLRIGLQPCARHLADLAAAAAKTGTGDRSTIGEIAGGRPCGAYRPSMSYQSSCEADQPPRRAAGAGLALERQPADEVAPCRGRPAGPARSRRASSSGPGSCACRADV